MTRPSFGRHRAPEAASPATVAGVTTDTDMANPVNHYAANVFPVGAAVTVAWGSTTDMWCTLGNLYRILGFLNTDPKDDGVPIDGQLDAVIAANASFVAGHLTGLGITPPAAVDGVNEEAKLAWLAALASEHGITTITLDAPPKAGDD